MPRRPGFPERLGNYGFAGAAPVFEHASSRTLVFNDVTGMNYRPAVDRPGDVFPNDTVGRAVRFQGGQRVWARQLNIEEDTTKPGSLLSAKIVNDGAAVWVLGFKTENAGVHVRTTGGGRTEILGNHQLNRFGDRTPQYVTRDAALSVVVNVKPYPEAGTTYGSVVETRGGQTRTGTIAGVGYAGYSAADLWEIRRTVQLDDDHPAVAYTGDWSDSAGFPRGFVGPGFRFAPADASVEHAPKLPVGGRYGVFARWIADWPGQDHSRHAAAAVYRIEHAAGAAEVAVDQRVGSDGWRSLGVCPFEAGGGSVTLAGTAEKPDRMLNTDGMRRVLTDDSGRSP